MFMAEEQIMEKHINYQTKTGLRITYVQNRNFNEVIAGSVANTEVLIYFISEIKKRWFYQPV